MGQENAQIRARLLPRTDRSYVRAEDYVPNYVTAFTKLPQVA
jgi:hypothetical protein